MGICETEVWNSRSATGKISGTGKDGQTEPDMTSHSSPRNREGRPTWSNRWKGGYRNTRNDACQAQADGGLWSTYGSDFAHALRHNQLSPRLTLKLQYSPAITEDLAHPGSTPSTTSFYSSPSSSSRLPETHKSRPTLSHTPLFQSHQGLAGLPHRHSQQTSRRARYRGGDGPLDLLLELSRMRVRRGGIQRRGRGGTV